MSIQMALYGQRGLTYMFLNEFDAQCSRKTGLGVVVDVKVENSLSNCEEQLALEWHTSL